MKITLDKSAITLENQQTAKEYAKDCKWMLDSIPTAWNYMLDDIGGYFTLLNIEEVSVTYDKYCMCLWCTAWYKGYGADGVDRVARLSFNLSETVYLMPDEHQPHCRQIFENKGSTCA